MIVVTALFGAYDRPKAPPTGADRTVMLTDTCDDDRWELVRRRDHGLSASRHPLVAKHTPHVSITDDDDVLWIDASFEPTGRDVREMFELVPKGGVGIHRHPVRDCYYDEATFSTSAYAGGHARGALALEQANYYEARGCPRHGGLWATGIVVWRGAQRTLGERWLAESMAWSVTDQISLPYVLHVLKSAAVTDLPGGVYEDPWFHYVEHTAPKEGRHDEPR